MEERGREARTHLSFCFAHCAVKLDSTPFQINISESDHMTQTQGWGFKSSLFFLVDLITFLTHDHCQCLYLSQHCRHHALGCQGKQHLSVITRVTAWKEEALGLILISLPRSELWRCRTVAGSSSILHQHPTPRVTHGLLMMPECHYTSPRSWDRSLSLMLRALDVRTTF